MLPDAPRPARLLAVDGVDLFKVFLEDPLIGHGRRYYYLPA
jgi:hypothetical protein